MQTIRRISYALASFDKEKQSHETYLEKKALLESACNQMKKKCASLNEKEKMISVAARYSSEKHISACCYKGHLFIGFQDKASKNISLEDLSGFFARMDKIVPDQLERRMLNAISAAENDCYNFMSAQFTPAWEKLAPMLDKIIEYEKEFEKLPESRQRIFEKSGVKEQAIDEIIRREEKRLHPLIEEAIEEMTGKDIGSTGKRDELSNMSTLEQDIAEKHYHKDICEEGFVDKEWHDKTHLAPLEERFEFAIQKSKEYASGTTNERTVEKEDSLELVRGKH